MNYTIMNQLAKLKKVLNRKLLHDDSDDILIDSELCRSEGGIEAEFSPDLGKDLLSGHDIIDLDAVFEDDYVCLDRFIASQRL
jgi:hypothetical protein